MEWERRLVPDDLVQYLRDQKMQDPDASIPEILRRAKEQERIAAGVHVHRATAWRAVFADAKSLRMTLIQRG